MKFNEFIVNYKKECLKLLKEEETKIDKLNEEKQRINGQLQSRYKKRPASGIIPLVLGLISLVLTFLTNFATISIWPVFLISSIVTITIGTAMDYIRKNYDDKTTSIFKELENNKNNAFELDKEKRRIERLLSDIEKCCEYYLYVVKEEEKEKEINLDINIITRDYCRLSTFLDKLYNGNINEFLNLPQYQRILADNRSEVEQKIIEAKDSQKSNDDNKNNLIEALINIETKEPKRRRK